MPNQEKILDSIDRKLIAALQVNCKTTLGEMGKLVGLKPPSVMERVRKLETAGVIKGYHAQVDPRLVGHDITAFIGVTIQYPKGADDFKDLLADPRILECHHVTGRHTLQLKVRTHNTVELEKLIRRLRSLDGVENSETTVVLSTWSERMYAPVGTSEDDGGNTRAKR